MSRVFDMFSRDPAAGNNPYKELRFLVVEDQEASRQTLRMCIQSMGGFNVDMSASHNEALNRIRMRMPDVIICDYILGHQRTGQQLFEELRRNHELPDQVIFIMVTAERSYEQVISAVELVPDDYVIKPFAPEVLRLRLEKAIQKKLAFARFYELRGEGKLEVARAELEAMLSRPGCAAYRYEVLRFRAETLAAADQLDLAAKAYQAVIDEFPFPWARAGLARVLSRQQQYDPARKLVDEVIEQVPAYFEAYDLKAHICTRQGDFATAHRVLEAAAEKTPRNWVRKKQLSIASARAGDFARAEAVMDEVVENDVLGDHSNAFLDLARVALDNGDQGTAQRLLVSVSGKPDEALTFEDKISFQCMTAIHEAPEDGQARFDRIRHDIVQHPRFSVGAAIDVVRTALHFDDRQLANLTAERILAGPDARQGFLDLLAIYQQHDLEQAFRGLQREVAARRLAGKSAATS